MKKLFLLLMIAVMAFSVSAMPALSNYGQEPEADGIKVTLTVDFGRVSKDCKGVGICDISLDIEIEMGRLPDGHGRGQGWIENGKLKIDLSRGSMSDGTYQTYLSGGTFKVEEDYTLPSDVAAALGVRSYTIKSGNYTISQTENQNGALTVSF